jgi:Fic family protein
MSDSEAPTSNRAGKWRQIKTGDETYKVFIPASLPPRPPIQFDDKLRGLLERANRALGRLEGVVTLLPSPDLFIYAYVRKEAVLSSQIEGTQSSLSELLLFENEAIPGVPLDDVREVSNYVAAMDHGLSRMKKDFPLSLRLIREMHEVLLRKGRGGSRTTQNPRRIPPFPELGWRYQARKRLVRSAAARRSYAGHGGTGEISS